GRTGRVFAAQGEGALAERVVGARRGRQVRVGIAARPRLDAGVEVEGAALLAELDEGEARHVDRDVEQEVALAEPGRQHLAVVLAGERVLDEFDAVFGGDFAAARLGGDDGDLVRADVEVAQQQRHDPLADAPEPDDHQAAGEGRVLAHAGQAAWAAAWRRCSTTFSQTRPKK